MIACSEAVRHPAAAVIDALEARAAADPGQSPPELPAVIAVLRAAVVMVQCADGTTQDELRALDRGWGDLKRGLARLAGRRHISEA